VRRRELRTRWTKAALHAGNTARDAEENTLAESRYLEAISADPLDIAAREALALARQTAATAAVTRSKAQIAKKDYPAAIASLLEAQERGASGPEVTALLRTARVGEAMTIGIALYQDRQYAAALFQFQKVLRLDPENNEARQKVAYTRNFLQDTQMLDRFSRLE
jgi:tetratricopeptide (TPR) repeat protein